MEASLVVWGLIFTLTVLFWHDKTMTYFLSLDYRYCITFRPDFTIVLQSLTPQSHTIHCHQFLSSSPLWKIILLLSTSFIKSTKQTYRCYVWHVPLLRSSSSGESCHSWYLLWGLYALDVLLAFHRQSVQALWEIYSYHLTKLVFE